GTISRSSVGKVRAEMGLTNKRRPRRKAGEEAARKTVIRQTRRRRTGPTAEAPVSARTRGNGAPTSAEAASAAATGAEDRGQAIEELEGDVDRLLFRVMNVGGLDAVEDLLRRSRRLLILGSQG